MYQTKVTNNAKSAARSKSYDCIQQDLFVRGGGAHDPDKLIINQVFDHYHHSFEENPQILKLLMDRKIDPDYAKQFKIGFADRTLGFELQTPRSLLGSQRRGHLQRLGLLTPTGHEFFRGAIVIPFWDEKGQIVGAYGRRPKQQRTSPEYHLYWNSQQVPLFKVNEHPLKQNIILCKSALEALTLATAGFENVVATMGIRGFNDIQLSQLHDSEVTNVTIAFDNTPAADNYALLIAQALDVVGISCDRLKLPLGNDINRFANIQPSFASDFEELLGSTVTLKQHQDSVHERSRYRWVKSLDWIDECVEFYLAEQIQTGMSRRSVQAARLHLERFKDFCFEEDIHQISIVTDDVLDAYQEYLARERSTLTGMLISKATMKDRTAFLYRMLSRLHYYGIISNLPSKISEARCRH